MARILNLIVLALEARGLYLSISDRKWNVLIYYTQLSNLTTAASSLLLVVFGQTAWVTVLRYLSTCMLVMTFLVTVCILIPMGGDAKVLLWSGNGLYHHVLCPVLSTASYLLAENHVSAGTVFLPPALTLVYGLIMLYLNGIGRVDGPYPFFWVHKQSAAATVLWMAALTGVITAISALVWRIG